MGSQNRARIDIKGGWKNDEKMMMTRMANKLDIGGYETVRPACPEPTGGGRRRAKTLHQYSKKHWMKELGDGCWHASPKPPDAQRAGGIIHSILFINIYYDIIIRYYILISLVYRILISYLDILLRFNIFITISHSHFYV